MLFCSKLSFIFLFAKCNRGCIAQFCQRCNETYQNMKFPHKFQKQKNETTCYRTSQSYLKTITLKTKLTCAVKRRKLLSFPIFS